MAFWNFQDEVIIPGQYRAFITLGSHGYPQYMVFTHCLREHQVMVTSP